jgi:hypothetical protein
MGGVGESVDNTQDKQVLFGASLSPCLILNVIQSTLNLCRRESWNLVQYIAESKRLNKTQC